MKKRILGFFISMLMISTITSISGKITPTSSDQPAIVYVNDDFNETTPGWGYDHFNKIRNGIYAVSERGTVYVFNGTYNERVQISKMMNLIGEDKKSTIIHSTGLNISLIIDILESNITIQNFTLTYYGDEQPLMPTGIFIGSTFFHLMNISIKNLDFTKLGNGIVFINVSNLKITQCHFHHNTDASIAGYNTDIYPEFCNNITIHNCTINNNGKYVSGGLQTGGISIDPAGSLHFTISDCIIYDNIGMGIVTADIQHVRITHNHIYRNSFAGILSHRSMAHFVIENNTIQENNWSGIVIDEGQYSNTSIMNNIISHNGRTAEENESIPSSGLFVDSRATDGVIITYNQIDNNDAYGIILAYECSGVQITKNNLINNTKDDAYFRYYYKFFPQNQWKNNFWSRPRVLPKLIMGNVYTKWFYLLVPWINIDWHPAQKPYDIPGI